MFLWLSARYLEHRSVTGIVEGFERFLASRGLAQPPDPLGPPAIVFVDLSGFTRLTRERGDESAVRAATSLQRRADEAARLHGGRLVKLLGDGAMLRLRTRRPVWTPRSTSWRRWAARGRSRRTPASTPDP